MQAASILIIEDEHALGTALAFAVRRAGHLPTLVASGAAGLAAHKQHKFDAIVLDIGLPDMSGLTVLEKLRARDAVLPVLVITAHATLDHAIHAQKLGATHYLPKPLDLRQFEQTLAALLAKGVELTAMSPAPPTATLVGAAACMQGVFIGIARACASDVPALLTGPSGSGKTLAAHLIHAHSKRAQQPLETLDCGEETKLAELNKALNSRAGTLVLARFTDLSQDLQSHLASWLTSPPAQHPRLIASSREDLPALVEAGTLRAELYYALAALSIPMPPLRERTGDIPALAAYFTGIRSPAPVQITPPALAALQAYEWPGNVRELRHTLDYALSVCRGARILLSDLPPHIAAATDGAASAPSGELDATLARWLDAQFAITEGGDPPAYDELLDRIEATLLRDLLGRYEGKPTHLAAALRMNRATLRQKLRRAGIQGD